MPRIATKTVVVGSLSTTKTVAILFLLLPKL